MALANSSITPPDSTVADYICLTKPSVTLLVVFSYVAGLLLAGGCGSIIIDAISVLATALASASSAAFNMWYDRDIDALMERTQKRPVASGVIAADDCLVFSFVLGLMALCLMASCVNYQAAALLFISMMFYCVVYTVILKRRTDQNIVIGGIAGSFPPLIGALAATGQVSTVTMLLFLLIFLWTPAHFWALAICRANEYRLCSVPMLPLTRGVVITKWYILAYTLLTICCSFTPCFMGEQRSGLIYFAAASFSAARFIYLALQMLRSGDSKDGAIELFLFSISYLFILLITIVVDHYVFISIT